MDVIEASHFEVIKQFILVNPVEWKLQRNAVNGWLMQLNFVDDYCESWSNPSLGELLKSVSREVSSGAISKRRAAQVSLGETSSNSATLDEKVREQTERDPYDLKDTYGGVLPG